MRPSLPFPRLALSLCLLASPAASPGLQAQGAPQDNWTLDRVVSLSGVTGGLLRSPYFARVLSDGTIVVVDSGNHRLQLFTATGAFIRSIGKLGSGDLEFNNPYTVTEAANGDLVVVDSMNHRIQVVTPGGVLVRKWGTNGTGEGAFINPVGAEVLSDGRIAVAEWNGNRVQIFEADGRFVRQWSVGRPHSVARLPDGNLIVVRHGDHVVAIYSPEGTLIRQFGGLGSGDGQLALPTMACALPDGKIVVADRNNHRIQILYPDGSLFRKWGAPGRGAGQFDLPSGISVAADGRFVVADTNNHRIQFFDVQGKFLSQLGVPGDALADLGNVQFIDQDDSQNLIVVQGDSRLPHVQTFSKEGAFVSRFNFEPSPGHVFRSEAGKYYVGHASHLDVYDARGVRELRIGTPDVSSSSLGSFGSGGVMGLPDREGNIIAADLGQHRIQKFSPTGTFLKAFGEYGEGPGQLAVFKGLGLGADGNIVARSQGRLQRFTTEGVLIDNRHFGFHDSWFGGDVGLIVHGPDDFFMMPTRREIATVKRFFAADRSFIRDMIIGFGRRTGDIFVHQGGTNVEVWRRGFRTLGALPPKLVPMPAVPAVRQRTNGYVDLEYSVTDGDSATVTTALVAYRAGSALIRDLIVLRGADLMEGTAAKVGTGVATGVIHRVTWNPAALNLPSGNLVFEALARDDRPQLLDVDYVTLPSSPARAISRGPVLNADLNTVWAWLLATGDPALSRTADGEVAGPGGVFTYTVGAETRTNYGGRAWLFARLGAREATAQETQFARLATSTSGAANQFPLSASSQRMGPRPGVVNEWGIDTSDYGPEAWWLVPVP